MKKSLSIILLSLLFVACGGNHCYTALMQQADSLLTADKATAAYRLLAAADTQKTAWHRSQRMAYELLKAEAQNKAYIDFKTDSILRPVAQYYDSHGTSNQRLRAHYILGCAYRDMKEAPMALLTWEQAVTAADTTAADCDFSTLSSVYGQMADTYFRQYMPNKELEAQNQYCFYSLLSGDTLSFIKGLLRRNDAFLALKDTAAIYKNVERVHHLCLERGLKTEAARVYAMPIRLAVEKGLYSVADSMIQIFEKESGLFNDEGNIEFGREKYYDFKGRYYLAIGNPDSAEKLFRKLLKFPELVIDGYRGLLNLYEQKNNADSVFRYAILYEEALCQYLEGTQTHASVLSENLYDYSRQQQIAHKEKAKSLKLQIILLCTTLIGTIIILLLFRYYKKEKLKKEEKERELFHTMSDYNKSLEKLEKVKEEARLLQKALTDEHRMQEQVSESLKLLSEEKEEQVRQWEATVNDLRERISWLQTSDPRQEINESIILAHFHEVANAHICEENGQRMNVPARVATDEEWQQLIYMTQMCHPKFYLFLRGHKFSDLKMKVCLLSRFSFRNPEMAKLTASNVKSISNARMQLANLFGLDATGMLDKYLVDI